MLQNLDPVCENINSIIERAIEKKKDAYMRMIREVRRIYGKEGYCIDSVIGNSHDYRPHYTVKDAFLVAGLKAKRYHRKTVLEMPKHQARAFLIKQRDKHHRTAYLLNVRMNREISRLSKMIED